MRSLTLLSAVLLLLSEVNSVSGEVQFTVLVKNSVTHSTNGYYQTHVADHGILLGGLNNLQESGQDFTFTYTVNRNFGLYLQSVNGLPGAEGNQTFWQLLVNNIHGTTPLSVGIGCFTPRPNDEIILNYATYAHQSHEDL